MVQTQTVTLGYAQPPAIVGRTVKVPLLDGTSAHPIHFDNAASTPPLKSVVDTVNAFLEWYSSVHRGSGFQSQVATRALEDARAIVGAFVGARAGQHSVIFGKNTTEAINTLAQAIPFAPGDVVLCSLLDHHSNLLPWRGGAEVAFINCDPLGRLDEAHYRRLLELYAGRVRLVAVTGCSNVTGAMPPLDRLATAAHRAGAEILVDCAQLAAHHPIDIGDLDDPAHLDYVAISGHKLYAPFGAGALIGRSDTFEAGVPLVVGGGSATKVTLDSIEWSDAPQRFEAGSPNTVGIVAMAAAIQALQAIGMARIAAQETALTAYALQTLASIPGLRIYGDPAPERAGERLGIIPFAISGVPHRLVAAILSAEYGIAVRSGAFCAQPYVRVLLGAGDVGCGASRPAPKSPAAPGGDAGLVRASLGLDTSVEDIDTLADALLAIAQGRYRGSYAFSPGAGTYAPQGWNPDFSQCFSLAAIESPCTCYRCQTAGA